MSDKQEKQIRKFLTQISTMDKLELEIFARQLYMAKDQMDQTVFKWVRAGVDKVFKHFDAQHATVVVNGEIKAEEL